MSRPFTTSATEGTPSPKIRLGANSLETTSFDFTAPIDAVLSPERVLQLRRSPRLSGTPTPSSPKVDIPFLNAIQDVEDSHPGTPYNECIQDEPSSVLASRIMRAQDNPSPPPRSPPPSSPFKFSDFPFPSDYDSPNKNSVGYLFSSPSLPSIPTLRPLTSPPSTPTPGRSEHTMLPEPISPACIPLPSSPMPTLSTPVVEVQQSHKTGICNPDIGMHNDFTSSDADNQASTSDRLEEEAVANELSLPLEERGHTPTADSGKKPHSAEDLAETQLETVSEIEGQPVVPSTPRRSIRPRRSTAAYASSPQDSPSISSKPSVDSSSDIKGRKTEHMSRFPEPISQAAREKSPSRKKPVVSKRQLGSLSPGSVTLLNQLLPPLSPIKEKETSELSVPSTSQGLTGQAPPIRFPSPHRPTSPYKIRLQPADLDDPNRTPAKRIPTPSTKMNNNFFTTAASSKANIFKIPPNDSPARRITLIGNETSELSPFKGKLFGSPVRPLLHERSKSVEPQPLSRPVLSAKKRSGSVEPVSSNKGKEVVRSIRMSSAQSERQNAVSKAIPEGIEPSGVAVNANAHASPLKASSSRLKQTTSRIPRMKPYSRLVPAATQKAEKSSGISRRVDWNRTPSMDTKMVEKTRPTVIARPHVDPESIKTRITLPGPSLGLKRKREPETPTKPFSPTKLSPVVVVPTLKTALSRAATEAQPQSSSMPVTEPASRNNIPAVPVEVPSISVDMRDESSASAPIVAPTPAVPLPSQGSPEIQAGPDDSTSAFESTLRRTTRSRKATQSASQLQSSRRAERPPPSRRRVPIIQDTGPFSSMSAIALRALTNSNTTKNQRYLAAILEMEVIRKEGPRPTSPVMKVKTISEKAEEEKQRDRNARAERRARRNRCDSDDVLPTSTSNSSQSDTDEDEWDQRDMSPIPRRHARGAGEDEDYETPDKSLRPAKRMRLVDDGGEDEPEKRHVKWDRGLCTEMYLDDIKPRQHARSKPPDVIMKGCLAPTAKALRLDTLGNLPNAESPLKDLVQENVVVKKFVYDTDVEEVAPVPAENTKNTRSKSRKSKS